MGVGSDWGCEATSKTKISYLDGIGVAFYKDVLGLQVSVQHPIGMDESDPLQHLVHVGLQKALLRGWKLSGFCCDSKQSSIAERA